MPLNNCHTCKNNILSHNRSVICTLCQNHYHFHCLSYMNVPITCISCAAICVAYPSKQHRGWVFNVDYKYEYVFCYLSYMSHLFCFVFSSNLLNDMLLTIMFFNVHHCMFYFLLKLSSNISALPLFALQIITMSVHIFCFHFNFILRCFTLFIDSLCRLISHIVSYLNMCFFINNYVINKKNTNIDPYIFHKLKSIKDYILYKKCQQLAYSNKHANTHTKKPTPAKIYRLLGGMMN
jgi:hypothetical protein